MDHVIHGPELELTGAVGDLQRSRPAMTSGALARLGLDYAWARAGNRRSRFGLVVHRPISMRSGCSIAIVWAIIPPIEAPTTCAAGISSALSRPAASSAMSSSV